MNMHQGVPVKALPLSLRDPKNRRSSRRFPTSQRAFVLIGEVRLCACELVDMSARGAQLNVATAASADRVPQNFDLFIVTDTYLKTIPVEVRWRRGSRIGVRYLSEGVIQ